MSTGFLLSYNHLFKDHLDHQTTSGSIKLWFGVPLKQQLPLVKDHLFFKDHVTWDHNFNIPWVVLKKRRETQVATDAYCLLLVPYKRSASATYLKCPDNTCDRLSTVCLKTSWKLEVETPSFVLWKSPQLERLKATSWIFITYPWNNNQHTPVYRVWETR